jgi:hypothetical protein
VKLDDAIAEVARARKRLEPEQGRIARKNARQAVKLAIGTVLRAMDREYPLVRKERKIRVAMTPLAKKRRETAKRVRMMIISPEEALKLAAVGIKIGSEDHGHHGPKPAVPSWIGRALETGVAPAEIKRGIRSRSIRARIEAMTRLRSAR